MPRETKFPIEYTKMPKPVEPGFKPDFIFDSHGRLVMPFTREHLLTLKTMPGSKDVKISTEPVLNDPASIKSGYLDLSTALKVGPKDGWIVQLAGGDFPYPISYYNEKTKDTNFYVDKEGNVYLKGTIYASVGKIGGWNVTTNELYAGSGSSRVGLKPGSWPFYAGADNPNVAPARIDTAGNAWFSSIQLLSGPDVGDLAHVDVANLDTQVADGTTYKKVKALALSTDGMVLLDQVVEGTYGKVKRAALSADGMVLLDETIEGTYGKVLSSHLSAGKIKLRYDTVKEGEWYNESGVEIDATHGINIYGTTNALTTRATKTGTIQCYVGADGSFYAGAGAIRLNASGLQAYSGTSLRSEIDTAGRVTVYPGSTSIEEEGYRVVYGGSVVARMNAHGFVVGNTKAYLMRATTSGRYAGLYVGTDNNVYLDCTGGYESSFCVRKANSSGTPLYNMMSVSPQGDIFGYRSGYAVGAHFNTSGSPVSAGLRIIRLRKDVTVYNVWTPEQRVNFNTTVSDGYHPTTNFANFPNGVIHISWCWISVNAPAGLEVYFWDLGTTGFKWKARHWDDGAGGISGTISFLVIGW